MSEAVQKPGKNNPEGYSPKNKPEILKMMEQQSAPAASGTYRDTVSGGEPPRLSDIRPLLDGMKGHNYALPDCIKFILERVGGHKDLDFWNIAALTGDTVAQVYNHNPASGCEYCVSGYLSGPEHMAYIFDVLGYDHEYVTAEQFNTQTAQYLRKITMYLNKGVPVLVKTNLHDIPAWKSDVGTHCLIIGYNPDKNALELLVSGTKPIEYEITGDNKPDLIFIGEKQREVSREEVYLNIIKRMPYWLTLPERNGLYFGSAAYRAWADDIEQGRFAEEGLPLWDNYGVYVCNLATNGDFAMFHLRELAEMNPRYSDFSHLNSEILKLIPTEKPDGSGKNLLWIQLDELHGGMDINAVRETMRDEKKRSKVSAALRDYAKRLDQVVRLLTEQIPEGYSPKERPEILSLAEDARQIEKPVQTINYKNAEFEVVRRLDVIWVGCVDYAVNNADESDIGETLKRFQGLVETAPIKEKVNPDWSAALSINYTRSDKPCGLMFANESYTDQQDERYDIFTQPGGLWLRVKGDDKNAKALLGKETAQLYEFFEPLRNAAKENGYAQNPDVPVEVEYHCHAEYKTPPHTCYAYIPVIKTPGGYSPKERPEILKMVEENAGKGVLKQMINRVKTANGRSYIDGVPTLRWGEWKDNTYCGCVTALLNAAGISVSYEEVMGLSGVCWQAIMRDDWDPSSQMPQNGLLCEKNVGDALGVDVYSIKEEKELADQAKKSIDAGVPVLLVGGRWAPEWTLTCGYAVENNENRFFGRTYFDVQNDQGSEKVIEHQSTSVPENEIYTDNRYFCQTGFPGVYPAGLTRFYDRKKEPISRKQALKVSLETCIKMFEQKPGEHHRFGYDAYDVLIAGFELGEEEYRIKCHNDQYHIGSMMDARRAAAIYLEMSTGLLDGENAEKLAQTARNFQMMLDNLSGAIPYEKTADVFNTCSDPVWDTARRQNLVQALRANKELEQLAREKIAEILASWA